MIKQQLKHWAASSKVAPLAALPIRLDSVVRHNAQTMSRSVRWLFQSREHTNFTYDLTPLNREHLVWFITAVTHCSVSQARGYLEEILTDHALRAHVQAVTAASKRRRLADLNVRYGRRIGWYALVRALKPEHVVETGTDKGLGTVVFAAALLRNGSGRLTTIDINPDAGYLIAGRYATVTDQRIGDSLSILAGLDSVDLFLHDSDHAAAYEAAELAAVTPHLTDRAVVLSDNAQHTNELAAWSETHGRRFLFFNEQPRDHWYPGDGIGVSLPPES
jgi:predicted O-methyltransferase YrrM